MHIAVYTITRERLEYTQRTFESLEKNAGLEYDHLVIDNGSQDGTVDWLRSSGYDELLVSHKLVSLPENVGISRASNMARSLLLEDGRYDLIVKIDNDCDIKSPGILASFASIYAGNANGVDFSRFVLGPAVLGLSNPLRLGNPLVWGRFTLHQRAVIGGIFRVVPAAVYAAYPDYPETLPKAWGQDDDICEWLRMNGFPKYQVDNLVVEHMDTTTGQAAKYPEYFERKWKEEKERP